MKPFRALSCFAAALVLATSVITVSAADSASGKDPIARGRYLLIVGNCNDCHENDGVGNLALGSTNLTRPELYLYGSDRASILESIVRGRRGTMPAFDGQLKPEEIKAVAIYIYYRALPPG